MFRAKNKAKRETRVLDRNTKNESYVLAFVNRNSKRLVCVEEFGR